MFVNSISTHNFTLERKKTDLRSGICHINRLTGIKIIAELSGAECASGAPWVRKCANLPIREILVIT